MALPMITPEQRRDGLAKARRARRERAELLTSIKERRITLADVLRRTDNVTRRTRVEQLVGAVPGIGAVKTRALLLAAGIHQNRRVAGLGDVQRQHLINATSVIAQEHP
jgi:hypothetical protein